MQLERERSDHPEISATTAKRPEQVRIFINARLNKIAVRQYDIGRKEIIDAQTAFAGQMSDSTTQR